MLFNELLDLCKACRKLAVNIVMFKSTDLTIDEPSQYSSKIHPNSISIMKILIEDHAFHNNCQKQYYN